MPKSSGVGLRAKRDRYAAVLKDYIRELRGEIASGGKHEFKEELKDEEMTLRGILDRLDGVEISKSTMKQICS